MSSLIKSVKLSHSWLKNNPILLTAVRNHWNKDYKPGPYPVTEAERIAAAEKYNLHPDEYKPYPDDGQGAGDYPNLPYESGDFRDPFYPWDNPELKRNFNETLHAEFDLIREDRVDVNFRPRRPMIYMWAECILTIFGAGVLFYIAEYFKMFHPAIPKQYPNDGKKHYTFETAE